MHTPRLLQAAALFGAATLASTALLIILPSAARAQTTATTAVTDPVGYLTVALPANSDTYASIPFTRPSEFTGAIASVATSGTSGTITLAGTPGFTAGAFAPLATAEPSPSTGHKTYYAIIGPKNVALTPTLSVTSGSPTATASAALPVDFAVGDTVTVAGYTFTVSAVSGTTVTLDRNYPGTTASGQAATYNHSPSEGRFYTVTANDTGSLTVNLNGDSLGNVAAGTQMSVIPYWTFGTTFPASNVNVSFLASVGTQPRNRGTQILIPDLSSAGSNLAPSLIYYFNSGAWRQANDQVTINVHDDDLLLPDTYFIARNISSISVAAAPLTFTPTGSVLMNRESIPLQTQPNVQQDNAVTIIRPTSVALKDTGLVSSNVFTSSTGTTPRTRGDQLFVYDNSAIGTNKGASAIYYYYNGAWRLAGDSSGADVGATVLLEPGSGLTIRKAATTSQMPTSFWLNSRNYLN